MSTDDRVKVLEGEFKLIKSELRQTLGSVRDFLLDLKLPPMQEEPGLTPEVSSPVPETAQTPQDLQPEEQDAGNNGFGGDGMPPMDSMPDFSGLDQAGGQPATIEEPVSEDEVETLPPLDFDSDEDDEPVSSGDMPGMAGDRDDDEDEEEADEEAVDSLDEEPVEETQPAAGKVHSPQVNMLANVIRWVSLAKKELGSSQLPVFLDVYSTTGNLTQDMRDIILHLAEVATNPALADETPENGQVISEQLKLCLEINRASGQLPEDVKLKIQRLTELLLQQSMTYNKSDVWSMLLVDLHGILTGGGSSIRSIQDLKQTLTRKLDSSTDKNQPFEKDLADEADNFEDEDDQTDDITYDEPIRGTPNLLKGTRPARLRLVMPVGEGGEQELDLGNLFIATDGKSMADSSRPKSTSRRK